MGWLGAGWARPGCVGGWSGAGMLPGCGFDGAAGISAGVMAIGSEVYNW